MRAFLARPCNVRRVLWFAFVWGLFAASLVLLVTGGPTGYEDPVVPATAPDVSAVPFVTAPDSGGQP